MQGKWISAKPEVETPVFRKTFMANDVASARIDICGLGFFVLLVNGKRVTEDLFAPALTDYRPRDTTTFHYPIFDTFTHRVLYMTYDLTGFLREGENTVEVIVGNGWYRQKERTGEGKAFFSDRLTCVFDLTVVHADGSETVIYTDGSEKAFVYPILESNLYLGEVWDTRLLLTDLEETEVLEGDFIPERLEKQVCPPDRIIREIEPELVWQKSTRLMYDAGENITGWVKLTVRGTPGSRITMRFAEELEEDELWFQSSGGYCVCASGRKQIQQDSFILNGEEQVLAPLFVWHGFRYFDLAIEGETALLDVRVQVIHTDIPVVSSFESDDELLNWLYDAYIRSQLTNFHTSIPSDCPHRERLGYTGDGQLCSEAAMLMLGAEGAYRKWIQDILDCQNTENGHIQHTAPFMGGGGGPGGWGSAIVIVPYNFYRIYGDRSILEKTWIPMRRWIEYMVSRSEGHLVVREEEKGWCLGDWEAPEKMVIPEDYVNTCYLVKCLDYMKEIAGLLGRETEDLEILAGKCRKALHEKYFADGQYCAGVQGADVFAVWAQLPESEDLIGKIVEKYETLGRFDTGIFATDLLVGLLFDHGYGDLAVRLMTVKDEQVGFYFMMSRGATTTWEDLTRIERSHNHPMFGACIRHLYSGLLGIRPVSFEKGWSEIIISPDLSTSVARASGRIETGWGSIEVSFDKEKGSIEAEISGGIQAKIVLGGKETVLQPGRACIMIG